MPLKPIEVQSQERMVAMVIGEPGVGKTSLVKTIPKDQKVCVISAESGLLSVIEEVRSGHVSGFEVETFDDLIDIFNHLNEDEAKASYQWVFIDSLTEIGERCFEHIKKQYPTDKDTLRAWSKYGERFQKLIKAFRDLKPYNVVFTCLPKINKDENNVRYKGADVPGKAVAEKLPAYFDEVLYYRVEMGESGEYERFLLTQPIDNYVAKDRSGRLDLNEAPDLGAIYNKIMNTTDTAEEVEQ